jgi:uncharacterized protein
MFATFVNAGTIILGTILGLLIGSRLSARYKQIVFTAVGAVALMIGISMALQSERTLYLALSLVLGGLVGTALGIEDAIYRFGEYLKNRFIPKNDSDPENAHPFAQGFLTASVLFCVGALAIIGSFEAGALGSYSLLLTKSVMDGFMAILLTAAYGIGVGFSALSILIYQGALTLLAGLLRPFVTPLMLSEISGVGGVMVVMIGLNLLDLRTIKTANFLPGLVIVVFLVLLDPWIGAFVL